MVLLRYVLNFLLVVMKLGRVDGIIEPICPICDQPYWDYIKIDMEKID